MANMSVPADSEATDAKPAVEAGTSHFAKAIDEVKAGAQALGKEAQDRAETYRDKFGEKIGERTSEWRGEARARGDEAKEKAFQFANDGKARASEAIAGLGKLVEDNAGLIDEKVGSKYGDYARSAARGMQDTAARIDAKELTELGEDAKEFVREKPALAVGIAAATGFMLARMFRGSKG